MKRFFSHLPEFEPGQVWLVGAGPGDPGLLSLHGANAIQQADVIVYDALVNDEILGLAKHDVELHYAGKRGGKPSPKQQDITIKLIEMAREGKRVLRLKGGDPFVFGRGGEECLQLVEANIAFRIVPGISAGLGGLAYAGIPLTHRDVNQSVMFLTGHDAGGVVPSAIDWQAVSRAAPVLVFYMAIKHWDTICGHLIKHGRDGDEPVAFINNATTAQQNVIVSTLSKSVEALTRSNLRPPALVVVGKVVNLRQQLDWFGTMELAHRPVGGLVDGN